MISGNVPRTALVVEDECFIRLEMVAALQEAGWDVLEAETGEEAVAFIAGTTTIHMLVTDIRLAGILTGWDVAEAFRATMPSVSVMYTSANPPLADRIVKDGIFMEKPWSTDVLVGHCETLYGVGRA